VLRLSKKQAQRCIAEALKMLRACVVAWHGPRV
jgi:hypothetical protein